MGSSNSTTATLGESSETNADPITTSAPKKSLYQRVQDKKRGPGLSEDDIRKYTGKSRDELAEWSKTQPGVAGNQIAGKLNAGPTSGLGGMAAAEGFGGWGPGRENAQTRGMKFPPQKEKKVVDDDESD